MAAPSQPPAPHPDSLPGGEREKCSAPRQRATQKRSAATSCFKPSSLRRVAKRMELAPCVAAEVANQRSGLDRSGLSLRNATSPCSEGHFLWVTFLLGQQKKSDSASGRRSKRPLRKRQPSGKTATEGHPRHRDNPPQSHWMTSLRLLKNASGLRRDDGEGVGNAPLWDHGERPGSTLPMTGGEVQEAHAGTIARARMCTGVTERKARTRIANTRHSGPA